MLAEILPPKLLPLYGGNELGDIEVSSVRKLAFWRGRGDRIVPCREGRATTTVRKRHSLLADLRVSLSRKFYTLEKGLYY